MQKTTYRKPHIADVIPVVTQLTIPRGPYGNNVRQCKTGINKRYKMSINLGLNTQAQCGKETGTDTFPRKCISY